MEGKLTAMNSETIGVIAGTPVDTQMGISLLQSAGLAANGVAISKTPAEQTLLQVFDPGLLTQKVEDTLMAFFA